MSVRLGALLGISVLLLAGCGSGPTIITGDFEGRDCGLYAVDADWLVYEWSPPVPMSIPVHLVARHLASGVETELESDWHGATLGLDGGYLLYGKNVGGSGEVELVLYDLNAQTRNVLHRGKLYSARISGRTVVWQTRNDAGELVIVIASVAGGVPREIKDAGREERVSDTAPRISGNNLVFLRRNSTTLEFTFMYHNLSTGTTETLPIASLSPFSFDLSGDTFVYTKEGDDVIYLMDLATRVEKALVEAPLRMDGPVIRGNIVAWMTHMPAEDFKKIGGQPLIDERNFRTLHALNVDTGKSITPIRDRYMLGRVRISDDRQIYALVPREITTSPGEIKDVVRF